MLKENKKSRDWAANLLQVLKGELKKGVGAPGMKQAPR
jgi:hypothetical protein